MSTTTTSLRAARWATRIQFASLGFTTGAWGIHIPSAKAQYALDEARISLALFVAAFGAVAALSIAGGLVGRLGARKVALGSAVTVCMTLAALLHLGSFGAFVLLMPALGAASALWDVAINAEGTVLEAQSGKKVMSGFHGMFSLGGMAGAGIGALLTGIELAPAAQLGAMAAAMAVIAITASAYMLPVHPREPGRRSGAGLPRGTLATLGLLAAVGMVAEGAMYDWTVLYMHQETGAAPAIAPLAYASFSLAMAATRFAGDGLRARFQAARLMSASAALAAVAMGVVLMAADPYVALIGFAFVGIGFANVVPILFLAATRVPGVTPAAGIAAVSSVGYLGFVAGPPLVGGIGHTFSLTWGLGVVVAGAVLLAYGARRLPD